MLPVLAACVFTVSAALLLQVVPGPHLALDYMVVGTVSVMVALLVVFIVLMKTSFRGVKIFSKTRAESRPQPAADKPRPRASNSILGDLG